MSDEILRPYEILIVEDNPADAEMTRLALEKAGVPHNFHHVDNGEKAIAFLWRSKNYEDAPVPDPVMLDLQLPKKGGWEVLENMKQNESLKHIPVVVMSTSEADEDILKAYELQPNHMLSKFDDVDEYVRIATSVEGGWFGILPIPDK